MTIFYSNCAWCVKTEVERLFLNSDVEKNTVILRRLA